MSRSLAVVTLWWHACTRIQQSVKFHKLGFVVTDEQHRSAWRSGKNCYKVRTVRLSVSLATATPIPGAVWHRHFTRAGYYVPTSVQKVVIIITRSGRQISLAALRTYQMNNWRRAVKYGRTCSLIDDNPQTNWREAEVTTVCFHTGGSTLVARSK